jgi:16S rRNA G966 N2-methylase RsmD
LTTTKSTGIALSALARKIDAEHRQVEAATLSAILHARNAGQLLLEAKGRLRHGEWLPWLAANCEVKERQARNYMRIAERWELIANRQRAADLSVRGALELMGLITSELARETNCQEEDEADIARIAGEDQLFCGDCLDIMRGMPADSVDLVFGSPPYENARTYGIDYDLTDDAWVDWMFERCCESLRVCRGLVAFVVEGRTNDYRWSATPVLLMHRLHEAGFMLRKPVIYHRQGTPGSGGPDWLRNDYEHVVCVTKRRRLPWSDTTACGTVPKWGDEGSHRSRRRDGTFPHRNGYSVPERVNPGNVVTCAVGGGVMGSRLCHQNEAPFPERLAEFFVRSFCKPGGTVLDPFCGSGTTLAVARRYSRNAVGIDIRKSQIALTRKRLAAERDAIGAA